MVIKILAIVATTTETQLKDFKLGNSITTWHFWNITHCHVENRIEDNRRRRGKTSLEVGPTVQASHGGSLDYSDVSGSKQKRANSKLFWDVNSQDCA